VRIAPEIREIDNFRIGEECKWMQKFSLAFLYYETLKRQMNKIVIIVKNVTFITNKSNIV
jgi:hypothetical protein